MAQTIRYEIGGQAHAVVITSTMPITAEWAKWHVFHKLSSGLTGRLDRQPQPSDQDELDRTLRALGVTSFELVEANQRATAHYASAR